MCLQRIYAFWKHKIQWQLTQMHKKKNLQHAQRLAKDLVSDLA